MKPEALIGRKIAGRYTIKRLLGQGGMATVYVAERDVEPREVAVKIMNPELTADRSFVRRFQREAKAASMVKHPSSVRIYEYGSEDKLSYIVMERLVGQDLYELLEKHGALPQVRAARILAEVCDALQAAHDMGIIHRDLKPENIMVIPDRAAPNGERVKVLDFGIAKLLEAEHEDLGPVDSADGPPSAITRVGQIIGTPAYMSPEQCGMLPVDTRSDIYTCGVLLYQLVTGRLPFEGETPFHTASMHIHKPAPPPSALAPGLDSRLEALILKALAKRPAERHQTARHLGASLRKLLVDLSDSPAGSGPISRRQSSSRWAPQPPPGAPGSPATQGSQGGAYDLTPPATPVVAQPRVVVASSSAARASALAVATAGPAIPFLDDPDSIESARTLVSTAGELGAPPQVVLNDPRQSPQARPPMPSIPTGDDLPTLEQEHKAPIAGALSPHPGLRPDKPGYAPDLDATWPPADVLPSVPSPPSDDMDPEDRAVTLVRPPLDSVHEASPEPPRRPVREVKATLRSADDFGIRAQEQRPPPVQVVAGGTAKLPNVDVPPPPDPLAQSGSVPAASAQVDPLAQTGGSAAARVPARVLQTVRINQPAGTGVDPAPPPSVPLRPPTAATDPMPSKLPPALLPPTVTDAQQANLELPSGGLLSGRLGLLVGFMAGMVITGIVVLVYLFALR